MARKFVWITVMMSALTLGASAARADEGQRPHHGKMFGACKADMEKFCKDSMGNHEAMHKCMQDHANDLSDACKKAREERKEHEQGGGNPGKGA
jgi:hypothetical protein